MLEISLHITSEGGGTGAGIDAADIYLAGVLGLGVLYLALEFRQKGAWKRFIIPVSVIVIAASGLAFSFGVLPAVQPAGPPLGSVFVYMWPGSNQNASVEPRGFLPRNVPIILGVTSTVAWQNSDSVVHTAHSDTGEFDTGLVQPGQTKWYTFTRAGTFTYHCHLHQWRNGTITAYNA